MVVSYRFLQKGFTLIEITIVISIIGILFTALYPSLHDYLERGHRVENQLLFKDWIGALQKYSIDHGGIESQSDQAGSLWEWYCIESGLPDDGCKVGNRWRHNNLSEYFHTNPEGSALLQKMDTYCNRYVDSAMGDCAGGAWYLLKMSNATYISTSWGYFMPGDPADSVKKWLMLWHIYYLKPQYLDGLNLPWQIDAYGTKYLQNFNDVPLEAKNMCTPGEVSFISIWNNSLDITCQYVFE